jgi:hypothetical protein
MQKRKAAFCLDQYKVLRIDSARFEQQFLNIGPRSLGGFPVHLLSKIRSRRLSEYGNVDL